MGIGLLRRANKIKFERRVLQEVGLTPEEEAYIQSEVNRRLANREVETPTFIDLKADTTITDALIAADLEKKSRVRKNKAVEIKTEVSE